MKPSSSPKSLSRQSLTFALTVAAAALPLTLSSSAFATDSMFLQGWTISTPDNVDATNLGSNGAKLNLSDTFTHLTADPLTITFTRTSGGSSPARIEIEESTITNFS